jgi:hypothetical protein
MNVLDLDLDFFQEGSAETRGKPRHPDAAFPHWKPEEGFDSIGAITQFRGIR